MNTFLNENQPYFKYGFIYDLNFKGYARNNDMGRVLTFMEQANNALQIKLGLLNIIAKERKRAHRFLTMDQAGNNDDHVKKIFVDRISRMEIMFDYFANVFLAYMNTLLYSKWDSRNIRIELL